MNNAYLVIMSKNKLSGFLENEIASYRIHGFDSLITNAFAIEEDSKYNIYIKLSTDRDVLDWEFNAVYDYYDMDFLKTKEFIKNVEEDKDTYNPTWIFTLELIDDNKEMEDILNNVINLHKNQLDLVYDKIKNLEDDYEVSE